MYNDIPGFPTMKIRNSFVLSLSCSSFLPTLFPWLPWILQFHCHNNITKPPTVEFTLLSKLLYYSGAIEMLKKIGLFWFQSGGPLSSPQSRKGGLLCCH